MWDKIFVKRAEDWTFESFEAEKTPDKKPQMPIEADKAYVRLKLKSMRVTNVRKGLKKFYGAVHSFVSLGHYDKRAEFQAFTVPKMLKDIDATNLDQIIPFDKKLVDSVPYRGGGIDIDLGLFSIESVDYANSLLQVLQGMSEAAGVGFVSATIPFVKPLSQGVSLLTGTTNKDILEIGVSTSMDSPKTGIYVAIRARQGTLDFSNLTLDKAFRLTDQNGKTVGAYPYIVFSIESSTTRENWYEIPDIAASHNALREAAKKGNVDEAQEAFMVFKRTVLTSADLLQDDALELIKKIQERLENIFKAMTKGGAETEKMDIGDLKLVNLYES